MIYFDNAATTFPKPESVLDAINLCMRSTAVNAGRSTYELARNAGQLMNTTREKTKSLLGFQTGEIIFSPSLTVAANQVLQGLKWEPGTVVYTTPFEHNAVARVVHHLVSQFGLEWIRLPFSRKTMVCELDEIKAQFQRRPPSNVVLTHVSNVTGVRVPVEEIAALTKEYGATVIVDGAQAGPMYPVSDARNIDFYLFSGHKTFYGPFGIAGFWTSQRATLESVLMGGTGSHSEQLEMPSELPYSMEVGSPNIVAIAGLNAACDWLNEVGAKNIVAHEAKLVDRLLAGLRNLDAVHVYVPQDSAWRTNIVSLNVQGLQPQEVGMILDQQFGIAVRTGLHCAPEAHAFIGTMPRGTARIGAGWYNTEEEIEGLVEAIMEIAEG